jgi:hypothetical protein
LNEEENQNGEKRRGESRWLKGERMAESCNN